MKLRPNHMSRGNPKLLVMEGVVYLQEKFSCYDKKAQILFEEDLQYDAIMHAHYTTETFLAAAFLGLGNILRVIATERAFIDIFSRRQHVFLCG